MVTLRLVWFVMTAAAQTAEAPVPQARVIPLPRSQVHIINSVRDMILTKWTLVRFLKAG